MDNEYKAVELSDEDLAQVSGGKSYVTTAGSCGDSVEILDDGVCKSCQQSYWCWECKFRAPWCQEPILASPHENLPYDGK